LDPGRGSIEEVESGEGEHEQAGGGGGKTAEENENSNAAHVVRWSAWSARIFLSPSSRHRFVGWPPFVCCVTIIGNAAAMQQPISPILFHSSNCYGSGRGVRSRKGLLGGTTTTPINTAAVADAESYMYIYAGEGRYHNS
jgi:hypothetical protein